MNPSKYKVHVVDSTEKEKSIDVPYEILVRLSLTLFATNLDSYAIVHGELFKLATTFGAMGLQDERLMTPKLYEVMKDNTEVFNYFNQNT